jgi:shikimate kinase / 3-dehydroquinate synthase
MKGYSVRDSSIPRRIVLIGPSGSGKTELAERLASSLSYETIDTDSRIEERIGMPVFEFFARFGEPAFRAIETEVLRDACQCSEVVIATGGGVVTVPENWMIFRPESLVVGLLARPETLIERIDAQSGNGNGSAVRPLLAGDGLARVREQLSRRGPLYAQADVTIDTDGMDSRQVADEVSRIVRSTGGAALVPAYSLPGSVERSDIYVGTGVTQSAATIAKRRWPRMRHVWIVSDDIVSAQWGDDVQRIFEAEGLSAAQLIVPAGEASKSFGQVERLCREMTSRRVSRQDVVVALGGGVVGDLAGLVASICLRGLSLIQLPTSLLAMVDSSVGGKTGINTPEGKNLVGTFNQPGLVFVDSQFLSTLPEEEYRSGMAEVIKHSIIQPSTPLGGRALAEQLQELETLCPLPSSEIDRVLAINVGIKHSVVQSDERESGLRMILNFGHTTGHAIEADGYRYRHGEAVSLGMLVAARIALELERVDRRWVDRLESLLGRAKLPVRVEGQVDDIIDRLSHDKKNVDGSLHWVLPCNDRGVEIVTGVDIGLVRRALVDLGAV